MTQTYTLTKMDIAAFRQANYLHVVYSDAKQTLRATKRAEKTEKNPFAQDIDYMLDVPMSSYSRKPEGATFSELVYLYPDQDCHASAIVESLKVGDEIAFMFYPDAHTNDFMRNAGLHGDVLRLVVQRGKKRLCFDLAQSNCPDNNVRMCQGSGRKEYVLVA